MRTSSLLFGLALFALPATALADVGPAPPCTASDVVCDVAAPNCPNGGACGPAKCLDSNGVTQPICMGGTGGTAGSSGTGGSAGSGGAAGSGATAGSAGSGGSLTAGSAGSSTAGTGGTSTAPASSGSSDDGCSVKAPGRSGAIAVAMLIAGAAALFLQRRK